MSSPMVLGCIADDFTGATDLANNLVRAGMRVVQTIGVPEGDAVPEADAVVVALKSRTAPVGEAVADSLRAADWLLARGARQLYLKVCSTFDSTPRGNIGPVMEALMARLGTATCPVTPAFPATGRSVYQGHLFVGTQLLSDSSMRHHPLTPMTDSNLPRVLGAQLDAAQGRRVGLVPIEVVRRGAAAISDRLAELAAAGEPVAVVDIIDDDDLLLLGRAVVDAPLVVAGSGLAIGLAPAHGFRPRQDDESLLPAAEGMRAIVSGSCSSATNAQVHAFLAAGGQGFALDPLQLAAGRDVVAEALAWAAPRLADGPLLVYATAPPEQVRAIQQALGAGAAGSLVEDALARIAQGLVDQGVRQLVVAGGETSGAVVQALGVSRMRIGRQIAPGVPWCHAAIARPVQGRVHLALKSGNFGGPDFFTHAFSLIASGTGAAA